MIPSSDGGPAHELKVDVDVAISARDLPGSHRGANVHVGPSTLAPGVLWPFHGEMLVYDLVHIPLPVSQVRDGLLNAVPGLWQHAAADAYDEGQALPTRVGPFGPVRGLSKSVSVHLGKVRARGEAFVIPVRWSATSHFELFPEMEADLEIAPLGRDKSQLTFSGSYDPPMGSVGRHLDRLLLNQFAEATVRALLRQLAAALLAESGPGSAVSCDAGSIEVPPCVDTK